MTELGEELLGLERRLLDPAVRRSSADLSPLLSEEFREFGQSGGAHSKVDVIAELAREAPLPPSFEFRDFRVSRLGPAVALVTYLLVMDRDGDARASRRSSIWRREGEAWRMLFHQGTPSEAT